MTYIVFKDKCLTATGHSNAAKTKQYDMVCCAVSTIMYSIPIWFKPNEFAFIIDKKNTSIAVKLLKATPKNKKRLAMGYKQLQYLQQQYPKYIKITK